MNIISIDPSKYHTGIFMLANGKETSMTIDNPRGCSTEHASAVIFERLMILLDIGNGVRFNFGLIEGYAFNPHNKQGDIPMAEVGGVIKLAFYKSGIPFVTVPVQTWKSITGLDKIDKDKFPDTYLKAVYQYYNQEFETTHEADAWLMWHTIEIICAARVQLLNEAQKKLRKEIEYIRGIK